MMFNFVNDVTALSVADAGHDLNQSMPRWGVLFGSGWVLVYPSAS